MQHAPCTVRSADWLATSKMTLALIAKDIGKSSSYFESLTSVRVNKRPWFGSGLPGSKVIERTEQGGQPERQIGRIPKSTSLGRRVTFVVRPEAFDILHIRR